MAHIASRTLCNWSHPSRVRGLKLRLDKETGEPEMVAPLAGAWIETDILLVTNLSKMPVAPLAGAWIETGNNDVAVSTFCSRTPRGCVD